MNLPEHLLRPDVHGVERLALNTSELARALGCSERHIQSMAKSGALNIPSFRLGRLRLFPVEGVKKWLVEKSMSAT